MVSLVFSMWPMGSGSRPKCRSMPVSLVSSSSQSENWMRFSRITDSSALKVLWEPGRVETEPPASGLAMAVMDNALPVSSSSFHRSAVPSALRNASVVRVWVGCR